MADLPDTARAAARRVQRPRPRCLRGRLEPGLRVASVPDRPGRGRPRLPRAQRHAGLVRGRRRDVLGDPRGARPDPRGRRSTARPRADDGHGTRQRRGGEQRGRLGGGAARRPVPAWLGLHEPRGGRAGCGGRRPASRAADLAEAPLDHSARGSAPSRRTSQPPGRVELAQVDHGRGRADQLAAVDRQVGRRQDLARRSRRSRGARARRCGWRWSGRPGSSPRRAGPRSAARRGARGPRGRRAGSGARGWRSPGSPAPGAARAIAWRERSSRARRPARASPAARST